MKQYSDFVVALVRLVAGIVVSTTVAANTAGSAWLSLGEAQDAQPVAAFHVSAAGPTVVWQQLQPQGLKASTIHEGTLVATHPLPTLAGGSGRCAGRLLQDGRELVLLCAPRLARLVLDEQGAPLRVLPNAADFHVFVTDFSVAIAPSGLTLVATTDGISLSIWQAASPTQPLLLRGNFPLLKNRAAGQVLTPSAAYWQDSFHILVPLRRAQSGAEPMFVHELHQFTRSIDDEGDWHRTRVPHLPRTPNNLLTESILIPNSSHLFAAYVIDSGLYLQAKSRVEGTWGVPQRIQTCGAGHLVSAQGASESVLAWVGDCERRSEPASALPLARLFSPDQRRSWLNNDVYALRLGDPAQPQHRPVRLTGDLSYTEGLALAIDSSGLHVLRSGRSRVGFELDSFGAKQEVFYRRFGEW